MFLSPKQTRGMLGKKHEKKESKAKEKKEHMAKKLYHGSSAKMSRREKDEMIEDKMRADYGRGDM